jgi:hypothetical protein
MPALIADIRTGATPRMRRSLLALLGAALLLAAGVEARTAWLHHQAGEQLAAYHRAQAALTRLPLPPGVQRLAASSCSSLVCGHSVSTPTQIQPALARLLDGRAEPKAPPCLRLTCSTTVYGHIDGYPAFAIAFWHLLLIRHGHPPSAATSALMLWSRRPENESYERG